LGLGYLEVFDSLPVGRIVKAYSNIFDVRSEAGLYQCTARGKFKLKNERVFAGDRVRFSVTSEGPGSGKGVIEEILPRETLLTRPPVANVEQAVVVFTLKEPAFDHIILDRFLVLAESEALDIIVCLNKSELGEESDIERLQNLYEGIGYRFVATSAKTGRGISSLKEQMMGKLSVLAGQSGVGKSTIINSIDPGLELDTSPVSSKVKRGTHTTRNVQLLTVDDHDSFVVDTPGFTYVTLTEIDRRELAFFFPEMYDLVSECRFSTCVHWHEPGCAIKAAVAEGVVAKERYAHYVEFLGEIIEFEDSRYS